MPRNAPKNPDADDPFDDDWGTTEGDTSTETMPDANVDPTRTPFLKPHNLKEREGQLILVKATGGTEYSDVVLHVQIGGKDFRIGLRTFDPSYQACLARYGKQRADWHGKLRYKVMPHKGRPDGFVAVRPI